VMRRRNCSADSACDNIGRGDGDGVGSGVHNSPFLVVSAPPDIVASSTKYSGIRNARFLAPVAIRSDQFSFRGTRLPYVKFPRDPSL
jgi:hypothetical protein